MGSCAWIVVSLHDSIAGGYGWAAVLCRGTTGKCDAAVGVRGIARQHWWTTFPGIMAGVSDG